MRSTAFSPAPCDPDDSFHTTLWIVSCELLDRVSPGRAFLTISDACFTLCPELRSQDYSSITGTDTSTIKGTWCSTPILLIFLAPGSQLVFSVRFFVLMVLFY